MKFYILAIAAIACSSSITTKVSASGYGQIDQPKKSQLQGPSVFSLKPNNDMESSVLLTQKNSKMKETKG